jgi:hypothetical protein
MMECTLLLVKSFKHSFWRALFIISPWAQAYDEVVDSEDAPDSGRAPMQQKWDALGLDLYGGFRRYDVDRPDIGLKPMNVFTMGAMNTF